MGLSVLIVDDEQVFRQMAQEALAAHGFVVHAAATLVEARQCVDETACDAIVLDRRLPDGDGIDFLRQMRAHEGDGTPVIVVTAFGDVQNAVDALHLGAADYLVKPVQVAELVVKLRQLESTRNLHETVRLTKRRAAKEISATSPRSVQRRSLLAQLDELSLSPQTPLLLGGPPGAGKRLMAEALHEKTYAPESFAPFIEVHCGAMGEEALAVELFGRSRHRRANGHFTGAFRGLIERADGGTLFLDGIGELPPRLQAKLLDVLDNMRVRPLGAQRDVPVRMRLIAASHHGLANSVANGSFRADLYHRLAVFSLKVPPLTETPDDIAPLAQTFLAHFATRLGKPVRALSASALQRLASYDFPGNVRELRNIIERAVILAQHDVLWASDIVLPNDASASPSGGSAPFFALNTDAQGRPYPLEHAERLYVKQVLQHFAGRRTAARDALGISYPTFLKRLRELGIPDEHCAPVAADPV